MWEPFNQNLTGLLPSTRAVFQKNNILISRNTKYGRKSDLQNILMRKTVSSKSCMLVELNSEGLFYHWLVFVKEFHHKICNLDYPRGVHIDLQSSTPQTIRDISRGFTSKSDVQSQDRTTLVNKIVVCRVYYH